MGKVSGEILRFWGNSGEILEHRGEIVLEGVGHPTVPVASIFWARMHKGVQNALLISLR